MSERARALEQARETALRTDATYLSPSGRIVRVQGHRLTGQILVDSRGRVAVRNIDTDRLSYVHESDLRELAVDPPPSGAGPQAEELRAANVANLREMVGMAGRHRETLLAVRECILALARAAEATQHRQDRRRWAESLKEQHQRHVIESDALRKVLAAWEITANERSARLAAVEAERDRLKASPCVDGSPHYCPNCDRTGYYVVSPSSAPAAQTPETTTDTVKPEVPNLMAALKKSLEQLTPTGEKDPR